MKRLIISLLLLAGLTSLQAQEAFYIYRNDGEFNGFFYDDVKSMRLSKTDLDLTERDEYVVQEIETKDSVYRIPLCAIDSIGFQQPEIIFSKRFYNLKADDCPYKGSYIRVRDNSGNELYRMDWYPQVWDESSNRWIYSEQYLPKVGDVLYIPDGEWDGWSGKYALPFICKVTKVEQYEGSSSYGVYYDYVDSFDDVFEQIVSVEQIGHDDNGVAYSRMAGLNKTPVGYSGNDNLTLASVSGKFTPINQSIEDLTIKLSVDLDLSIKAHVAYNIVANRNFFINVTFKEDAEVGASLTLSGSLEETMTWQLAGVPLYFPSFLPILQVRPGPGAFLKTAGDMSLTINTPKLAVHGTQAISISGHGVTGSEQFSTGKDDPDNTWGIQLSLNGSAQAGTHFPFKIETNTWCKKIAWCSTGVDIYAGPKFDASFTLDPVALVKRDAYNSLASTKIKFSPVDIVFEGNALFSAAGGKEKIFKIFEGEQACGTVELRLFPEFAPTEAETPYFHNDIFTPANSMNHVDAKVLPQGKSLPFKVGLAAYNYKDQMVCKTYGRDMYSFFNPFPELSCTLPLLSGRYTLVPILNVLGYDVPVWGAKKMVECTMDVYIGSYPKVTTTTENYQEGTFVLSGLMTDDDVEFELVKDSVHIVNGKVWWGSDLHDYQEQTESHSSCGNKVQIFEESMAPAEKKLGPEEMGARTFYFKNTCQHTSTLSGDITPSGPIKSRPGSYTYNGRDEYNHFRAKVTRNGLVRYSPIIAFGPAIYRKTYN
ncbi:MAG: hypothetical protein IJ832_04130 [Bacteroidaceae bacterium]|nr:hypothetical protein [Bacteroidaceae bacterium]